MGRRFRLGHIRRRGQVRGGDETVLGRGQYCVGRWHAQTCEGLRCLSCIVRSRSHDGLREAKTWVYAFGHMRKRERVRDGDGTVWKRGQYCEGRWDVHEGYVAYPALHALAQRVGREERAHVAAWVNGNVLDTCRGGNGCGTGTGLYGNGDGRRLWGAGMMYKW